MEFLSESPKRARQRNVKWIEFCVAAVCLSILFAFVLPAYLSAQDKTTRAAKLIIAVNIRTAITSSYIRYKKFPTLNQLIMQLKGQEVRKANDNEGVIALVNKEELLIPAYLDPNCHISTKYVPDDKAIVKCVNVS
jgi:hypothetical protein